MRSLENSKGSALKFSTAHIAELVKMMDEGTISTKIAKQVFEEMAQTGEKLYLIVEAKGADSNQ